MTPLTSASLVPAPHGFFTRQGGVSTGIYAGLNCGLGSKDASEAVAANRARVAAHLGVSPASLLTLHQVHSADVVTVRAPFDGPRPKADAMVTDRPGLALGALAADCAPVLFAGTGVVGAAHAGWRGALAGVLEATAEAMRALGAGTIHATVGPCISQTAYEVGPEFFDAFRAKDPGHVRFFAAGLGDRLHFDLPGFCVARLQAAGVEVTAGTGWTGQCTYAEPARFYSYRRATHDRIGDYGRMISAIRLPG
ncbi:MAG: peptidoglycan editing factor PgeF [Pseudomonadota bacterium]